ncbi:hypothetical protein [Vibrio hippocampi]|nr:hypothetical protein [Vibrio hippocampi]
MGNDTILHFALAGSLGLCSGWLSLLMQRPMFIAVIAVLIVDEGLQYWIPTRDFSFSDMGANVFGCLSGVLVVTALHKSLLLVRERSNVK